MGVLYPLFLVIYQWMARIFGFFNQKARLWADGRKSWKIIEKTPRQDQGCLWMHCASLGEFEQGRPVLEMFRVQNPDAFILLTFFSPSGYEVRKHYPYADAICYIPTDTKANVVGFLSKFRPTIYVVVKHDIWLNFTSIALKMGVPTYFISVNYNPNAFIFKWYGRPWLDCLRRASHVFTQSYSTETLLRSKGVEYCSNVGDTRVDRALQLPSEVGIEEVAKFVGESPCLVLGSIYNSDMRVIGLGISEWLMAGGKIIAAPHHVDAGGVSSITQFWDESQYSLYSTRGEGCTYLQKPILILDCIGVLNKVYRYGQLAYIGGGFNKTGLHNTQEPAAYGLPLIFGPNHKKFTEAMDMVKLGFAQEVSTSVEFVGALNYFKKTGVRREVAIGLERYLSESSGASEKILKKIVANR